VRSPHRVWIEVEKYSRDKVEVEGFELVNPAPEGAAYDTMPFQGILRCAPAGFEIPLGTKVFTNYIASDDLMEVDGVDYYISDPSLIVAYGDVQPYRCIIVQPHEEGFKSEHFIIPEEKKYETTKATVLSSDVDGFSAGDEIEYQKNLDWECLVGSGKFYYIQWTDKIYKRNGELINDFSEINPRKPYTSEGGIWMTNKQEGEPCTDGLYKGQRVLVTARQHIRNGGYIHKEFIGGCYN
jgi:hypothetical protein